MIRPDRKGGAMPSKSDVSALLKGIDLFADLSKKELSLLADCLRPGSHNDKEEIVVEGGTDARFFVITSGNVAASANGKRLGTMGPGQYFGEISLIDRGPRTATVTAVGPVTTLSAASFSFRPILKQNPDMMLKLLVRMCERVRSLDRRLVG
jgi:CRP/FNR family transcriptional regulator, cyclic AMP receptor protein